MYKWPCPPTGDPHPKAKAEVTRPYPLLQLDSFKSYLRCPIVPRNHPGISETLCAVSSALPRIDFINWHTFMNT